MYKFLFKRLFDIIFSIFAIIILSPIMIVISILVWLNLGFPILFKQQRPGKNEKIFTMYKFRTMNNKKDSKGDLLPDKDRITNFGKFLRATSLDELPELFNILFGHMSIIGPRPLLIKYLPLYNDYQKRRHSVRPGLTGLAQINGRNAISWNDKFRFDVEYVDKISLKLDIVIFFKTIFKVFKREGINQQTDITMEEFKGNN